MKMKMRMKRIMGLLLALFMTMGCMSLNPIISYANDTDTKTFNINQGSVNITQSGTYTIEGTGQPTPNEIRVTGDSITAKITLKNVNIDVSNQIYNSAFLAKGYGQSNVQLTIILQGTNSLKSGEERAGLTWNNNSDNDSTLEIEGDGSLTATGGKNGAGIGSSWNRNGGTRNITITGGTVIATGGYGAAGIGGDRGNSAENITITGGTVTATGGDGAAGIGGGASDSGKNITITGGTVTATGGARAAGIGGGRQGGSGENITITGGTVTATGVGWSSGAGIGGGGGGSGKNITIAGGTVTATGGDGAAGIGGGDRGSGKGLTITGGTVTATGGDMTAGIGGGTRGSGENITIAGGTVTATGGEDGIGGGAWGAAQHIKITGGSVKANSISTTPTDDKGNSVYLAKLENQDSVNEVTVDSGAPNKKTFKRAGNHPDNDTAFYLYLTEKDHDLVTSKGKYKAKWDNTTNAFTVKPKVFDKEHVTAMVVTTQPTKRVYTDGEPLDLTGLKVTLTDNQTLTQEVEFKDFDDYKITANPENKTPLTVANNNKPVTLSHISSFSAGDPTLTVAAKTGLLTVKAKYKVTYKDGVNGKAFADQVKSIVTGADTPAFTGTPTRAGYVFDKWSPNPAGTKVTADATYTATWKEDKNGDGTPDDQQEHFTVTYKDGVNGKAFADHVIRDILTGTDTPKFNGKPSRAGYVFSGWSPDVAEKVTANATYKATWKEDKNHNNRADEDEDKYTVTYVDGVDGQVIFPDKVTSGILSGTDTPKFNGTPTREGYVFAGWSPDVADKVTGNATYVAQWKKDHFTVTFKDGDKTQTVKVKNGKAIDTDTLTDQSMPNDPTKAGYTFKEWNTKEDGKGEKFTGASVVNADMTVYAIYTKDSVPTPKPTASTPELKPQPKKHIGVIPKTGESASFEGLLAALGFSIAGLAILRKKKMMEENK
ncbi:InlB B-repeat-containing protein [Gardnerella sp. KA00390]